jgi:hypothetical protein
MIFQEPLTAEPADADLEHFEETLQVHEPV